MAVSTGFSIAASALSAFRVAAEVSAHNMTNVNTDGYTRQRAIFRTSKPQDFSYGSVGTGVDLATISRIRDSYLDRQLEEENSEFGTWEMREDVLESLELYFNETTESGMSRLISDMLEGWQDLASNPDDQATRVSLMQRSVLFTNSMNKQYDQMTELRQTLDQSLDAKVDTVNSYTTEIASMNNQIISTESDGNIANDLRDRRDFLVSDLSKYMDFNLYEQTDGGYAISIENKNLVFGTTSTDLEVYPDPTSNPLYLLKVRWSDTEVDVDFENKGEIGGLLYARDTTIPKYQTRLDTVTNSMVEQINRIHASGQGVAKFTTVTGSQTLDDITVALNSSTAGLDITPIDNGTFEIQVDGDADYTITVDADGSLEDLRDNINAVLDAVPGANDVVASISNNQLVISATTDEFAFNGDDSDTLMALGINTFFSGYDATDIAVNSVIENNASYISAAQTDSPGDNTNALAIAALRNTKVLQGGTQTIEEYYGSNIVGELGSETSEAHRLVSNQQIIIDQVKDSIDQVSSVSLDEEMTNIIQLEQATTAIARYITILSNMLDEVVNIIR